MPAALWRQATPHNHRVLAVGWDRGADRASNDADVSSIPPIIPYGGFSPVRLEGWPFRRGLPNTSANLSLLPACAGRCLVYVHPSCASSPQPLYHVPTIGDDGCSKIKAGPLVDSERPLGVKRGQHPNSVGVFGTQGKTIAAGLRPKRMGTSSPIPTTERTAYDYCANGSRQTD